VYDINRRSRGCKERRKQWRCEGSTKQMMQRERREQWKRE